MLIHAPVLATPPRVCVSIITTTVQSRFRRLYVIIIVVIVAYSCGILLCLIYVDIIVYYHPLRKIKYSLFER